MKFNRITNTNYFEQESAKSSFVKAFLYSKSITINQISFNNDFLINNKKWIILFVKGNGSIATLNKGELDVLMSGDDNTGYIIWLDDYKSLNDPDYAQRFRFLKLKNDVITSERLYQFVLHSSQFDFVFNKFKNQKVTVNAEEIVFSNPSSIRLKVNNYKTQLSQVSLDLSNSDLFSSFKMATKFKKDQSSFINGKVGFISEKRTYSPDDESLLTMDLFDKDDLDNALFSGTYFPFEEIYEEISNKYFSKFEILKPNLKTNFIDSTGTKYYSDFDNSDLVFCFSRVVDNKISGGNDPQWDKYILRPLGKLKLKTISNSKILLGSSGTESFQHEGNELEVIFEDSENILVDEKNIALKKHNEKTRTSLLKISPSNYNLDSEKSPIFKNKSNGEIDLKQIDYEAIPFPSITNDALPIIPTLSFRDNPELFELEEVFKKIRLKAHQKVQKLNKSNDEIEYLNNPEDYITPQGFLKNKTGYKFIPQEGNFQFSLENIDTNLDLSLRKDQVFFVLTPAIFKKYLEEATEAKLIAKFKINKDLNPDPTKRIEFIVDISSCYPTQENDEEYKNDESIVIFKYNNRSLRDTIEDRNFWTNEGNNLNYRLDEVQKAIRTYSKLDYDPYFKNILDNKEWNGVIILNIPITKSDKIPQIFKGLSSSQRFYDKDAMGKINLETDLKFQYVAFPVNKTFIEPEKLSNGNNNPEKGKINIKSTSFFGLIDYNPFKNQNDYSKLSTQLKPDDSNSEYRFVLSKLFVEFRNSSINEFITGAFIRIPKLFDDNVELKEISISNKDENYTYQVFVKNLIRLDGSYQKDSEGNGDISFSGFMNGDIEFNKDSIIKSLVLRRLGFRIVDKKKDGYRFDVDFEVKFSEEISEIKELFSFEKLDFQDIGFSFDLSLSSIPFPQFDLSKLLVIPTITFNGNGFLRSFPIKFSHFQNFKLTKTSATDIDIDFDFFKFPKFKIPNIAIGEIGNLFSFIFDFDLGTLGNLGGLKDLKGQILIGWTFKGGFAIGFKLNGPSRDGLHLNLFGALKIDVEKLDFKQFKPEGQATCSAYFLRLVNAELTVLGKKLPPIDGIIFSQPGSKTAWLINGKDIGFGQRVGPALDETTSSTVEAIKGVKDVFKADLKNIDLCQNPIPLPYKPDRNYIVYSESILPEEWPIVLKFIFNDPKVYGLYLGFKGEFLTSFSIDILYKKLSDSLGVYSTEIQLPDAIRNREMGGASLRLPNIGIEVYTNGDWKGDIGFPKNGNDWSRSGFIQLRTYPLPMQGYFGFYIMKSKIASLTLFKGYISDEYSEKYLNIIQAGFALRVGVGDSIDGGVFYVGANICVYGILEGAFAFKKESGLSALFPDHFAVLGRVGAIAELVGYVNFVIIKASIYISLRAEFGLLLVYTSVKGSDYELRDNNLPDTPNNRIYFSDNQSQGRGLQPVKVYIEGEVVVAISVTLFCVKFFGKKWCLVIHLSFRAYVRFEYTIGGGGSSNKIAAKQQFKLTEANNMNLYEWKLESLKELPMVLIPTFTRRQESETDKEETLVLFNFYIPFFGVKYDNEKKKIEPSKSNIFKDTIIQLFLSDLIKEVEKIGANKNTYENIRSILLDGKLEGVDVKITIPNYRPKFIDGVNDIGKIKSILVSEDFKFTDEEADLFIANDKCKSLSPGNSECLYRAIPAPISKNINVNGKIIDNGFELKIEELISENASSVVIASINDLKIPKPYYDSLEEYFNDYKTQFIERNKVKLKEDDVEIELRDSFLIPEFFKLISLLSLEKAYSKKNPKKKNEIAFNPYVKVVDGNIWFSEDGTTWKDELKDFTNENLEELIGQVNYFYNSGLRLPSKNDFNKTISINELIKQSIVVTPIDHTEPDAWKKVKISIAGEDITSNILGNGNDKEESVKSIWNFVDTLENKNGFNFDKLKNEFEPVKFVRPYKLVDVTIGVQSNFKKVLNTNSSDDGRFYEIPKKLFKHGSEIRNGSVLRSKFSFELTAAKYENAKGNTIKDEIIASSLLANEQKLSLSKCLNVQIQVKQSVNKKESVESGKIVLELVNVLAEDLTLITLLKDDGFSIDKISFYGKIENDGIISFVKLTDVGSTIIKTNLSPRTTPPIFESNNFKKKSELYELNKFIEDSFNPNDTGKGNFTRLIWEALTTNSGGYYLTFDTIPKLDKDLKEIIISFETSENEIPYYFNSLKVNNRTYPDSTETLFDRLNKNELYLYIEQLKQNKESVFEYYPTIPSHDFGFEVLKKKSDSENQQQYLPLEFGLTKLKTASEPEVEILNRNKVLPIMPSSPTKDVNDKKEIIENGKVVYSHISPLTTDGNGSDVHNLNRYSTVGKDYKLKLGLRDIYGFRTGISFEDSNYKHYYFDKLIPLDAWPLIKFSYWFKDYNSANNSLNWTLTGNYNLQELLDLAGIQRDGSNNYKYDFGKPISSDDLQLILTVSHGILETLFSILAQLTDSGTLLSISNYSGNDGQSKIRDKVKSLITDIDFILSQSKMPSKDSKNPIEFVLTTTGLQPDEIEKSLSFEILIKREKNNIHNANDTLYVDSEIPQHKFQDLDSKANIWEYSPSLQVLSKIQASNNGDGTSNLKSLNQTIINETTKGKKTLSLGISSDQNLERVIYLINVDALRKLKIKKEYLENDGLTIKRDSSYLGIKPISNKLWFGNYEIKSNVCEFNNVDLDKSLRIVLEKIDSLLDKNAISTNLKAPNATEEVKRKGLFEKLIAAKKTISVSKLKEQIDWVMNPKKPDGTIWDINDTNAKDEFKEINLNKLTNFYSYDGAVSSEIEGTSILDKAKEADKKDKYKILTLSLDNQKGYNLISSKLNKDGNWNVFFDQENIEEKENAISSIISFSIKPQITHIELRDSLNPDEIVNSEWIQLIEPVSLMNEKGKEIEYKITDWTKIIREFPLKPIITKHQAIQTDMPNENVWSIDSKTTLPDAGNWEYHLSIDDSYNKYYPNDRIFVELIIKDLNKFKEDTKSFEGFISYWALEIIKGEKESSFKWEEFVEDMSTLFTFNEKANDNELLDISTKSIEAISNFVLKKNNGIWEIEIDNLGNDLKVEFIKEESSDKSKMPEVKVKVIGFNIFSNIQKAFSILPKIKVQRNFDVKNDVFKYETDEVEPTTPVTPLLRHYNPLGIEIADTFLEKVFKKNVSKLPFKATAKYLVDIDSNFPKMNSKPLPVIPIKHIESEGMLPQKTDEIFSDFDKLNGYSAFSLTIFNRADSNSDLPILYVETIYKQKQ